jgi:AcrR family transcriptional regulator
MDEKKVYILQNVGKLYLKFGIRGVTMDDVAAEFGISKKTLYQYFTDKEELVNQVIGYYLQNPVFKLNKEDQENAIDWYFMLRQHVSNVLKHFNNNLESDLKRTYPLLYEKVYNFKRERIYRETIQNIEEGIKEGLFRAELDPDIIAKLQVGRMLLTLNPDNKVFSEEELSEFRLFDKVMDYHMHAICTAKGLDYYRKQINKLNNFQNEEQA